MRETPNVERTLRGINTIDGGSRPLPVASADYSSLITYYSSSESSSTEVISCYYCHVTSGWARANPRRSTSSRLDYIILYLYYSQCGDVTDNKPRPHFVTFNMKAAWLPVLGLVFYAHLSGGRFDTFVVNAKYGQG